MLDQKTIKFIESGKNEAFKKLSNVFEDFCLIYFDFQITKEQKLSSQVLFKRVFARKNHTVIFNWVRQYGKSELICLILIFLARVFPLFFNENYKVCFTAPEKNTSSEIFLKIKNKLNELKTRYPDTWGGEISNDRATLHNGSTFIQFGIYKGYATKETQKSTKEGRTFNIIIRDEAHLGDDYIYRDQLLPALSTTGGIDVLISTGGFRNCLAKEKIESAKNGSNIENIYWNEDNTLFYMDYVKAKISAQEEYERTKNERWIRWIDFQEKYIKDNGISSDEVQKNLYLKWLVNFGNFIPWEDLIKLRREKEEFNTDICDVGIDWGKSNDETYAVITDYEFNVRDIEVFKGDYINKQCPDIAEWIKEKRKTLKIKRVFSDSTGVGDPVISSLKVEFRKKGFVLLVKRIVFTAQSKNLLARKGQKVMFAEKEKERLSYPANHKFTNKFEKQFRKLIKTTRERDGLISYSHPNEPNIHDDIPDSTLLSIFGTAKIKKTRNFETKPSEF